MKKIFNFLKNHPIYCLLFLCLLFLPSAVVAQPESVNKIIVRALGIDKTTTGYEISAIIFTPKSSQTFGENYKVVEGKGDTLYSALVSMSTQVGKEVALAHTDVIFVDNKTSEDGLIETIDYLNREYSLGSDTYVMYCPSSTKEIVKMANELAIGSEIRLGSISAYDEKNVILNKSNIESIYSSAYSPSKCTLLNVIEASEEEGLDPGGSGASSGGSETGGSETGGSSTGGSGSSGTSKKLLNGGKAAVFKGGKKVMVLSEEDVLKYRFTKNSEFAQTFTLENFSDANFTEAKITFTVTKSNVKYDLSFDKNTPICKIKINPTLMISEVNQSELDSDIYISPYMLGTKELKTAVEAKVCDDTKQIVEKFVDANLDVNQIYEKFNAKLTKKFQSYLSDLLDENEYLKGIRFEYECDAKIIS